MFECLDSKYFEHKAFCGVQGNDDGSGLLPDWFQYMGRVLKLVSPEMK